MHIFLTGARQVGKSTLVRMVRREAVVAGGFVTFFRQEMPGEDRVLYMAAPGEEAAAGEAQAVARWASGRMWPDAVRFDALGCALLRAVRGRAGLLIMDECGRLEGEALRFQAAVMEALAGDAPVLGVVQEGAGGWTRGIWAHPAVRVLRVTEANRDALGPQLLRHYGPGGGDGAWMTPFLAEG